MRVYARDAAGAGGWQVGLRGVLYVEYPVGQSASIANVFRRAPPDGRPDARHECRRRLRRFTLRAMTAGGPPDLPCGRGHLISSGKLQHAERGAFISTGALPELRRRR